MRQSFAQDIINVRKAFKKPLQTQTTHKKLSFTLNAVEKSSRERKK